MIRRSLILALASLAVMASSVFLVPEKQTRPPQVTVECLDASLDQFSVMWQNEVNRRFPDAVMILCHGGMLVEGQWLVRSDNNRHLETIESVILRYKHLYPGRPVVVLACNVEHYTLKGVGKDVWYAKSTVWCVPDRFVGVCPEQDQLTLVRAIRTKRHTLEAAPIRRSQVCPDYVGSIFEFVQAE